MVRHLRAICGDGICGKPSFDIQAAASTPSETGCCMIMQ
jgi:hypothetical protein